MDAADRLKKMYIEAIKEPFPIKESAYASVTHEMVADGQKIYGLSALCNFE